MSVVLQLTGLGEAEQVLLLHVRKNINFWKDSIKIGQGNSWANYRKI